MAWSAEVTQITKNETNVIVVVDFSDAKSGEVITRNIPANNFTPDTLAEYCQKVVETLEARDAAISILVAGPVTLPRDRAPTPEEQAKIAADEFFTELALYNALLAQVDKGIIKSDDPSIAAAAVDVKTDFLPEYANDTRFK